MVAEAFMSQNRDNILVCESCFYFYNILYIVSVNNVKDIDVNTAHELVQLKSLKSITELKSITVIFQLHEQSIVGLLYSSLLKV